MIANDFENSTSQGRAGPDDHLPEMFIDKRPFFENPDDDSQTEFESIMEDGGNFYKPQSSQVIHEDFTHKNGKILANANVNNN